jgi:hypothetical protein
MSLERQLTPETTHDRRQHEHAKTPAPVQPSRCAPLTLLTGMSSSVRPSGVQKAASGFLGLRIEED